MAIKNFLPALNRTDMGPLNENFIATELVKNGYPIRYWRTKSKAEVDLKNHPESIQTTRFNTLNIRSNNANIPS